MGNGQWTINDNGQWTLNNEHWTINIGQKTQDIEHWTLGNWTMCIGQWTRLDLKDYFYSKFQGKFNLKPYLKKLIAKKGHGSAP